MVENDLQNMSIEEIDNLIDENKDKIAILQNKIDIQKQEKQKNFDNMTRLFNELTTIQKQYYDYRTMLGSVFFDLTTIERETIETMMPIYEQKIAQLKKELENIDLSKVF